MKKALLQARTHSPGRQRPSWVCWDLTLTPVNIDTMGYVQ